MKKHILSFETAELLLLADVKGVSFDKDTRLYVFHGSTYQLRRGMIKAGIIAL